MSQTSQNNLQNAGQEKSLSFFDLANNLLSSEAERSREVVKKRFGLSEKEPQTLEKIGKDYGITRERVRQIISDALKRISKNKENANFKKAEERIILAIEENDGIMEKSALINKLSAGDEREANAVSFFGEISDKITLFEEKGTIRKSWIVSKNVLAKVREVAKAAEDVFGKNGELLADEAIVAEMLKRKPSFSRAEIMSYLGVLVGISRNKFDKWGLSQWREVNPKSTRERIYLVIKENKKPLHFVEIAQLIDEYKLSARKAHPQTVHNELIKDDRFVLVGRGIYALKEWGYKKGTIKDVLEDILKKNPQPMSKEEILEEVLRLRKVKKTTVMINLSNSKLFIKEHNRYTVKK